MLRPEIGDRIGAILSADREEVRLLGFGTYQGKEIPPPGINLMGIDLNSIGLMNPKLLLDNGKIVWGCECWWGPEAEVRASFGNRRVAEVDIEIERGR